MATNKNFTIERNNFNDLYVEGKNVRIGNMFEREGSIHMRVGLCNYAPTPGKITICNLNTGSVWEVPETEQYRIVTNCKLSYEPKTKG